MTKDAFLAEVVALVGKGKFPDYVEESAADIAKTLSKEKEIFIAGELVKEKAKTGESKVGGKPDVPADFEWPTEEDDEDAPLQFIAQINLAEVQPHDFDKKLPAKGMVWFFSIADGDRAGGGEIDSSTTKVIYLPAPGALKAHAIPEELAENEDATIKEHKIEFGPTIGMSAFRDAGITKVIETAIRKAGGRRGPVFVLNQHNDDDDGYMIADLDMYTIARNAFGEGSLSFQVSNKDLKAGKLGNAETIFNGGT